MKGRIEILDPLVNVADFALGDNPTRRRATALSADESPPHALGARA
jgi:hypothetical protein